MDLQAPDEAQNDAPPRIEVEADYGRTNASVAGARSAVKARSWRDRTVAVATVILAAAIGIGAWFIAQPDVQTSGALRVPEHVVQPVPAPAPQPFQAPMAGRTGDAQGVPLRVDDALDRFSRSVNAAAANRGSGRVPAR